MDTKTFYSQVLGISDGSLLEALLRVSKPRVIKKKQVLIHEGELQDYCAFLVSGFLRDYFLDQNGRETTTGLSYHSGSLPMACGGPGTVSDVTIEAMADSEVLCISAGDLQDIFHTFPAALMLYNQYLQESLVYHCTLRRVLSHYTALQRYQWFIKTYPELDNKSISKSFNDKLIASFLNITPVTLSRIRKYMREESVLLDDGPEA